MRLMAAHPTCALGRIRWAPLGMAYAWNLGRHSRTGAIVMRTCMLNIACVLACVLLTACAAAPSREALTVHDADAAMVSHCKFVGYVSGTSGWSGLAAGAGESNAQSEAREKAARLGATDIVWQTVHGGWGSGANGSAYSCPRTNG